MSDGQPDLAYATQLVHAAAYEAQSAQLARALSILSRITDARTAAERSHASEQLERYIVITIGLDLAALPGLLLALYIVRTRVLSPIDRLAMSRAGWPAATTPPARAGATSGSKSSTPWA